MSSCRPGSACRCGCREQSGIHTLAEKRGRAHEDGRLCRDTLCVCVCVCVCVNNKLDPDNMDCGVDACVGAHSLQITTKHGPVKRKRIPASCMHQ